VPWTSQDCKGHLKAARAFHRPLKIRSGLAWTAYTISLNLNPLPTRINTDSSVRVCPNVCPSLPVGLPGGTVGGRSLGQGGRLASQKYAPKQGAGWTDSATRGAPAATGVRTSQGLHVLPDAPHPQPCRKERRYTRDAFGATFGSGQGMRVSCSSGSHCLEDWISGTSSSTLCRCGGLSVGRECRSAGGVWGILWGLTCQQRASRVAC
jgi:hypothetical protein